MSSPYCQAQPAFLQDEISNQPIDDTATKVIVLIHGWNPDDKPDAYVASASLEWFSLVTALKSKLTGSDWKLITYHWERQGTVSPSIGANTGPVTKNASDFLGYGNATVAAIRAEQQGTSLSSLLNSQAPGLRKLHFIAHSAGSWAAREAMRLLLNANPNVFCQMTLLDPFIPDASTLVGTTTGLSTSNMNATAGLPGNSRIIRLEDYYSDDGVSQCSPVLFGTISTPGVTFSWRAEDLNLRVDWGDAGFPGLSLWYDCHSGPIQFYTDTVNSAGSSFTSPGLQHANFDLNTMGWKASLFYQEQQLRAIITSVSPATLPTSSSPQLITINGTNFKPSGDPNASSLIFYDPVNTPYPRTPINVTASSMQYNLNVQSAAGTWKVKVVNAGVESLPFSFAVTSAGGAQLTGLSISGPATVAENTGGQFAATAHFSDDSSATVTSSTSWNENSSATTISSSGFLSAGSVSSDTTVTISASYTFNGVTKSTSADVVIVNSGSSGGTTTIHPLVNGTFESGVSPWSPSGYADIVALSYPHLGSWYAYLCNANNALGSIAQFFPIPAGTTAATLQFYLNIVSQETAVNTAYDTMKVDLVTANEQYVGTIAQFSNLDKGANVNGSYVLKSYNIMPLISAYKGQSLFLIFSGQTDGSFSTIFRIDDVDITLTVNNPVSLTGLSIRGPSSIPESQGGQFWADAIFSDGTTQQISPNSWNENSAVTTITTDGFLTASAVSGDATVTVTATYTFNGVTRQATKTVTIVDNSTAHTLSSLAISGPVSMHENSFGQFTATAIFADGTSQVVTPSWSENSSATTISSGGLLNAGEVGSDTTVTVSASYTTGGITRNASQEVLIVNVPTPPTLTSLTISGPNSLNENTSAQYYATASFSDGTSQVVSPTWSENSSVTSITVSGLLNAGEVASDTSVTLSASYTVGGVTRSDQKGVTVLNTTGLPTYTLTVNAVNGTVAKNPDQASYTSGSLVVLTATPSDGYQFSHWSGDTNGSFNPVSVTMDGNKSITAIFSPVGATSNILFADDFNDNSLDMNKWTTSGVKIEEINARMRVGTDATDNGGVLVSVPIAMAASGEVSIDRQVLVHRQNDVFAANICVRFGGLPWIAVHYAYHTYTGGGAHNRQGTFISRDAGSPEGAWVNLVYESNPENIIGPFPVLWDTWFTERVKYSPDTGLLEYFVNDEKLCDYLIGVMPPTNNPTMQLGFRAWGWWTGHEQLFDDLVVSQAAVQAPLRRLSDINLASDMFQFRLNGPVGSNFVIQTSSNLTHWLPVSTNTIPAEGSLPFDIPVNANHGHQYYRAVSQ